MFATLKKKLQDKEREFRNSFGDDISTPEARRSTLTHFRWVDHAILRVWWHNFFQIDTGVYRANQPSPERLAVYKAKGIRTIINLRGVSRRSHHLFEAEACANLGLTLKNHILGASRLLPRAELQALEESLRQAEKPFLMHCKSGSDRAGFAAALYLMLINGCSVQEAKKQLHWRYLHLKFTSTGILDFFFDQYSAANDASPISLHDWIANVYDAPELTARFHAMRSGQPAQVE